MLAIASIVYCLLFHSNIHFKQERRKKNKINENNNDKNFYHGWYGIRKFIDGVDVDAMNNIVVPRCFVSQNAYRHSITQKILYFYLFNPEILIQSSFQPKMRQYSFACDAYIWIHLIVYVFMYINAYCLFRLIFWNRATREKKKLII